MQVTEITNYNLKSQTILNVCVPSTKTTFASAPEADTVKVLGLLIEFDSMNDPPDTSPVPATTKFRPDVISLLKTASPVVEARVRREVPS